MKASFADYLFHKQIKSIYLRNVFLEKREVIDFWDELWQGGVCVYAEEINRGNFSKNLS